MKIAISGCLLQGGRSGIGSYIKGLINHLDQMESEHTFDLYTYLEDVPLIRNPLERTTLRLVSSLLKHPILNIVWHNSLLPLRLASHRTDLLHIPSLRRIPLVKSTRLIATVHDMAPCAMKNKYDRLREFYHLQVLRRLVHRCDRIITVSYSTKQDLIKYTDYPEEKIQVIYSGIDQKIFQPIKKTVAKAYVEEKFGLSFPYFIYVSRLEHPGKNHVKLIEAFELFHQSNKEFGLHLIFVGAEWSGSSTIFERAQRSPLKSLIHFLNFVPFDSLPYLYNAAEAMIFPSLYEGFGFPLLEAMACGIPVACSETTALGEIGKKHAVLFNPNQIDDIAHALNHVLQVPKNQLEFNRSYAASFSWKKTAEQTLDQYRCLI
ncbi:MAG: glycosyltransferase family 1 protein [Chlamydiales bacterium]